MERVRLSFQSSLAAGQVCPTSIWVSKATTFLTRLVGLLFRRELSENEGLLLYPCGSIHTIGMRFTIDVLFLDNKNKVLAVADEVKPNRLRFAPRGTVKVLEIAQGNRIRTGINLDDHLIFD